MPAHPRVITASSNPFLAGFADVRRALASLDLVMLLVRNNNKKRYHRVGLGMFYITAGMVAWVIGLGALSTVIFQRDAAMHVPYVGFGIAGWSMAASYVTGGAGIFISSASMSQQVPLPLSLFVLSHVISNFIAMLYRVPILIILCLIHPDGHLAGLIIAGFSMCLISVFGFGVSLGLGVIAARFRDFKELIDLVMQFLFFLSATFWSADQLGEYAVWLNFNPFYHMIEAVRGPVLHTTFYWGHIGMVALIAVAANLVGFWIFARNYHRLPYWAAA